MCLADITFDVMLLCMCLADITFYVMLLCMLVD